MRRRTVEREVWPELAELGFELCAPHAAWRHWASGVDALHVVWERDDAFRLVAGVWFHAVPVARAPREREHRLAPSLGQLHVTRCYAPGPARADAIDRELWLADGDGLVGDLRGRARRAARSLEVLHDPRPALAELSRRTRWHPRPGSAAWLEVTGYLAAATGAYDVARPRLQRLLRELEPAEARRAQRVRSALALMTL